MSEDQQYIPSDMTASLAAQIKHCIACQQEIPAGASLCSVCRSYQRSWKTRLQFYGPLIAGAVALILLAVNGAAWFWGTGRILLGFGRDDVHFVSANTLGSAIVVNRGDEEVFVSHLLLTMPGRSHDWQAPRLTFEERLPVGQFLRREFPRPRIEGNAEFVRGLGATDFEKLVARAANGDPCLELVFFVSPDPLLRELAQAGPTLNTFQVGGYLEYWGLKSDTLIDVSVTGTGVVHRDLREQCK